MSNNYNALGDNRETDRLNGDERRRSCRERNMVTTQHLGDRDWVVCGDEPVNRNTIESFRRNAMHVCMALSVCSFGTRVECVETVQDRSRVLSYSQSTLSD